VPEQEQNKTPTDLEQLKADSVPSPSDNSAAELGKLLEKERDRRNEERFIWVIVATVFFDASIFPNVGLNSLFFIALELVFLLWFAEKCGVDSVVINLNRIMNKYFPRNEDSD